MKNNLLLLVVVAFTATMTLASCSKTDNNGAVFSEQTPQDVLNNQKAIIGSWQFIEKGVEVDMHNGQPCSFTGTKTPMVKWENATSNEQRDFMQNAHYSHYLEKQLSCNGSFSILNDASLTIQGNCQQASETIVELTATSLIVKGSNSYFKYRKLD